MKNKIFILLFVLIAVVLNSTTASAQTIGRAAKFAGINGGFYQHTTKESDTNRQIEASVQQLSVNGGIGFFQTKSLAIGFRISYESSIIDSFTKNISGLSSSKTKESNSFWGISSFGRYHKKISKRFFAFIDANVSIGNHTRTLQGQQITSLGTKLINDNNKGNFANSIYIFVRPGILYLVHSKIGIELSYGNWNLQYTNFQPGNGSGNRNIPKTISGFDFQLSSLNLGINYYFKSKPKAEPKPEAVDNPTTEATK